MIDGGVRGQFPFFTQFSTPSFTPLRACRHRRRLLCVIDRETGRRPSQDARPAILPFAGMTSPFVERYLQLCALLLRGLFYLLDFLADGHPPAPPPDEAVGIPEPRR